MTPGDPASFDRIRRLVATIRNDLAQHDEASFLADLRLMHATAYRLLHVGESANQLTMQAKTRHSHIPWKLIIAMRHILAHDFDGADARTLWAATQHHLEPLAAMCQAELRD